uniref:Phage major capsid protein n=1 Tax=uncultured bacterium fosmid pJB16B1 TaxID=1478054 RepID=A0A0H3U9F3_9BACT|nr:hypothetical protein [uncultured bacterium fosmid pJB16B1]
MATTFTGQEIYSKEIFKALTPQLAPLKAFSTDFSQEAKQPGESVSVQLVEADNVADFNASSNNFVRSASTNKKVTVTFGTAKIAGFEVTPYQVANFNPGWWKQKAEVNADTMADTILTSACSIITSGNFSKGKTIASDTTITLAEIAAIKAYAAKQKLSPRRCALGLDLELFAELERIYNTTKTGITHAQAMSELAAAVGVKQVFAVPQLPNGLLGFICEPSAIAVAGRNFRPVSDKPYESVQEIMDPESGIGMTLVEYVDGATGSLNESVTGLFASAVGDGDALIRITKA